MTILIALYDVQLKGFIVDEDFQHMSDCLAQIPNHNIIETSWWETLWCANETDVIHKISRITAKIKSGKTSQ